MTSAMAAIPVVPSPSFVTTKFQDDFANKTATTSSIGTTGQGVNTGMPATTQEGDYPPSTGPVTTNVNPETLPAGTDPYTNYLNNLTRIMQEGANGAWASGGPNYQMMLTTTGVSGATVAHAWCATFIGYVLKISGLPFAVQSGSNHVAISAADYNGYGTSVDKLNPKAWRKGDIITITRPGGSGFHVSTIWQINPTTGNMMLAGGNQGGRACAEYWQNGLVHGNGQPNHIGSIRRNWTIPANLDVLVPGAATA
jgi:hypothetical protein